MDNRVANNLKAWLEGLLDRYFGYIEENPRLNIPVTSSRWKTPGYAHASQLTDCPKKQALLNNEIIEKLDFSLYSKIRMEEGTQMGNFIAEALTWGVEQLNETYRKKGLATEYSVQLESQLKTDKNGLLAGQVDIVLYRFDASNNTLDAIPIEVKLTTGNSSEFDVKFWVQTCSYIKLLREKMQGYNCSYGFTFVLYDAWRPGKEPLRVFLTQYDDEEQRFCLLKPDESYIMYGESDVWFPKTFVENGRYSLTLNRLERMIQLQNWWNSQARVDNETPFDTPWSEEAKCGYKHLSKRAKSPIPTKISDLCPVFGVCWRDLLDKSGIVEVPVLLHIEETQEGIFLRSKDDVELF